MVTPLIDIDANPRQPGFKLTKIGSKIPSPPRLQRTGSAGHRSLFSVGTTGSPCHVAMPMYAEAVVSPTPTSKLPRKSTPMQSASSKCYTYGRKPAILHANLPRTRNWQKPAAVVVPSSSASIRTTPPTICDKPLPGPPIAQIMNPASPPKSQRTLVDAEVGTPTEGVWPVLQPENVGPFNSPALPEYVKVPQRSVSELSDLRPNDVPILKSRGVAPSVSNSIPSQMSEWLGEDDVSGPLRPRFMAEPCMFSPMNPYAKWYHAFSPDSKVPMNNPLAYEQQTLPAIVIPPRISSKRDSLPLPDIAVNESPRQLSSSLRSENSACTRWPELAAAEKAMEVQVDDRTCENDQRPFTEPSSQDPNGAHVTQSHFGAVDSISTWRLEAGSSLNEEAEVDYEGSVRVKRLSWHSSNPGTGPTLRISADADKVLLGRDESIPTVPAVPEHMLRKPSCQFLSDMFSGRVSKEVLVNTNVYSSSRAPITPSTEKEAIESKPFKITPIRSMQPLHKSSAGDLSEKSHSLSAPVPTEATKVPEILESLRAHPHGSVDASQDPLSLDVDRSLTTFTEHQPTAKPDSSSSTISVFSGDRSKIAYEARNYSTALLNGIPQKAGRALGTKANNPQSTARKGVLMTWKTPSSATLTLQKATATRSKTRPLLRSTKQVESRLSAISTRSPSPVASSLAQSISSQAGTRQMVSSRSGVSKLVARDLDSVLHDETIIGPHTDNHAAANKALRLQAKRSFKNVFSRRDPKAMPQSANNQSSKRSSVASSALAQCIRQSTNFSRVSLARPFTAKVETKVDATASAESVDVLSADRDRQAALFALEPITDAAPVDTFMQPPPLAQCEMATVIRNILDRVTSMKKESPDCLRGLEIAEAVLHAVDCSKQAKLSAELAMKHARDADLNAENVHIELQRLEKLCEPNFDKQTMQAIRQLLVACGVVEI